MTMINELSRNQTKIPNKTKGKAEKISILSYYPHQTEKVKRNSREIILKGIFLAECVEYTINVWIIDHSYGTSTNWRMHLGHT